MESLLPQSSIHISLHTDIDVFQKRDICPLHQAEQLPSYLSRMIGVWQIIGWRHFRNTSNLNFQCPFPFINNIPPIITEPASKGWAASSTLKRGLLPGARPLALSLCVYPDAAQGPRKHQRNRKNFSYSHVCLSVMHQEPVRGPWWVPTIPCAFWLFFFFFLNQNTCGFYWLDCDGRQWGERQHWALKMTKHFHLTQPSEEVRNEHIFLRESNFSSPACVQMSRTVDQLGMAPNIPGERRMIDVFSLMWVGEIFMQNSKKERNPSFYRSFFYKAFLSWRLTDVETELRQNHVEVMGSLLGSQMSQT